MLNKDILFHYVYFIIHVKYILEVKVFFCMTNLLASSVKFDVQVIVSVLIITDKVYLYYSKSV